MTPAMRMLIGMTAAIVAFAASPQPERRLEGAPRSPASTDSTRRWTFTIEQEYGTAPGGELVDPWTIGVDGEGRVYVGDNRPVTIKVFAPDGRFLRTIGRQGGGPGELRAAWIAVRGGVILAHDPGQSRTTLFDTSGTYIRSWTSFCCHHNEVSIDASNRIVVPATLQAPLSALPSGEVRIRYVRYGLDGTPIDTFTLRGRDGERLWSVAREGAPGKPAGATSVVVPFTPRLFFAHHPGGGFVTGWSADYRLTRVKGPRDSTVLVNRRWTAQRIPESMRRAQADSAVAVLQRMVGASQARAAVRLTDVPLTEPAYTRLIVDEGGNIWARRLLGGDVTHTAFDVFGPTGTYEGQAMMPVAVPDWGGVYFGRDRFYVRTLNADGLPVIVRLRVGRG